MDLDQLRKDAKALVKGFRAGDGEAQERARAVLGERATERFLLSDAQHVVAREHGFRTWPELKHALEAAPRERPVARIGIEPVSFYEGRVQELRAALAAGDEEARRRASIVQVPDPQVVVAREYGFGSWRELVAGVEEALAPEPAELTAAVEAALRGELVDAGPRLAREALLRLVQPERDPPREAFLHLVAQADDLRDPLNVAACFDRIELVQLLLEAGADSGVSPLWGITAIETALYHGARDTADLLAERGIEPYALWSAAALGRVDLLPELLGGRPGGHRPNLADVGWQPGPPPRDDPQEILDEALCFAALNGHDESVEWLLDHGADVTGAPYLGMTPLHFAAQFGRLSTVRLLLARGADPALRDRIHGGMPIGWCGSRATSAASGSPTTAAAPSSPAGRASTRTPGAGSRTRTPSTSTATDASISPASASSSGSAAPRSPCTRSCSSRRIRLPAWTLPTIRSPRTGSTGRACGCTTSTRARASRCCSCTGSRRGRSSGGRSSRRSSRPAAGWSRPT